MKRLIVLFLILIMLLSFCACGSPERKIVGTWLNPNGSVFCELMEDGTGIDSNGRFFTWKLNDNTLIRIYPHNGNVQQSTYDEETDTIKLPGGTLTRQK